jgi:hypothetical protein
MTSLRPRRYLALAVVVALMALLPATALAAGEESPETAGGTPPASTGWVPQGSTSEGSGGAPTGVRHGSSLGSGAAPSKAAPPSQETSYMPPSSSSYEAPSSAATSEAFANTANTVQTGSGTGVVKHPVVAPPVVQPAPVALGTATQVSAPKAEPVADTSIKTATPSPAESAAAAHDQVSSGPNPLSSFALLALILGGLVLACVVGIELRAGRPTFSRRSFLRL